MADKKENPVTSAPDLSVEEMATKRAEITKYYEDHIPSLETQLQYETLLRDIEKTRAERLQAQMFITKSMAEPPAMPAAPSAGGAMSKPANTNMTAVKPGSTTISGTPLPKSVSPKRVLKKKENATN